MLKSQKILVLRTYPCLVKAARCLLSMSQEDLSSRAGVPHRTLVRFENGEGIPREITVQRILEALDTSGIVFFAKPSGVVGVGFSPDT